MEIPKCNVPALDATATATYVRVARAEDLRQLSELLVSSFYRKGGWINWLYPLLRLGISEDLRQRIKGAKSFYACLAAVQIHSDGDKKSLGDDLVGTVEISCRHPYLWQSIDRSHIYLSNLAVRADLRRRGVAQKLLATSEAIALDWGFHDVYLHVMEDNQRARRLYQRAGYRVKEVEETPLTWMGLSPKRLLLYKGLP